MRSISRASASAQGQAAVHQGWWRADADSTFIRRHLETKHKIDFDGGLSAEQKPSPGRSRSWRRIISTGAIVDARWTIDANFDKGPRKFFEVIPAPVRSLVVPMIRRQVRKHLHSQGMGATAAPKSKSLARRASTRSQPFSGRSRSSWSGANRGRCHHIRIRGERAVPNVRHPLRTAAERHETCDAMWGA